jgi:hypothetical protein
VGTFSRVLESGEAVDYLRSTDAPSFELAVRKAGADEPELVKFLRTATDNVEQALSLVHLFEQSSTVRAAVERLGRGSFALLGRFPDLLKKLVDDSHIHEE